MTSTVLPDALLRTSPGLMARPPGMFSAIGITPMTRIGAFNSAMAHMAHATAAPPAMSSFIRSMSAAGLIEMPPVSNVMPLPTSPSTGDAAAPAGLVPYRHEARRVGAAAPDTQKHAHAEPLELVVIEHVHRQTRRRARSGTVESANTERRQRVARLVVELPRHVAVQADHVDRGAPHALPLSASAPRRRC